MKIYSWNVNGIRAAVKKGFFDWFDDVAADVVRFYVLLQGLETDITAAARGELDDFTQQERIKLIEQDLAIWGEVKQVGDGLLKIM